MWKNALIICSSRKYDVSNALNEVLSKIKTQEKLCYDSSWNNG
jgi:hypothetical protein